MTTRPLTTDFRVRHYPCAAPYFCAIFLALAISLPASADKQMSWPIFRGDPGLTGFASGSLPEKPQLLWKVSVGSSISGGCVASSNQVITASGNGIVASYSIGDGHTNWTFSASNTTFEAAPCIAGDLVCVGAHEGKLYGLDIRNGKKKWDYRTGDRIIGAANTARLKGEDFPRVFIGSFDNNLHCVNGLTGKGLWTYETESFINGSPAMGNNVVAFGGCDAVLHVVSQAKGEEVAAIPAHSFLPASPTLTGEHAYTGNYDGELLCIDIKNKEITWTYTDDENAGPFFSSPAVGQNQVIVGSRDERVHCVDRKSGKKIWTFKAGGSVDSSPVICGNRVVVGSDDGRLYILDLENGKRVWSYDIGSGITASPIVIQNKIITGANDGCLYAFGAPRPVKYKP